VPEWFSQEDRDHALHVRDRLLGCLPRGQLVGSESVRIIDELANGKGIPPNEQPVSFTGFTSVPYTADDYLEEQGVRLADPKNAVIREAERSLNKFATRA